MLEEVSLLIVDPKFASFDTVEGYCKNANHSWKWFSQGRKALEYLDAKSATIILLSLFIEDIDSLLLLKEIKQKVPSACIILLSDLSTVTKAAEALKLGIRETLLLPLSEEKLVSALDKVFLETTKEAYKDQDIIANSPEMQKILSDASVIAKSHANVFIHGESGTGKEVMAAYIHQNSLRHNGPFVKVNCAAIPETLMESEFFGHERGAFTGAAKERAGRFELAHNGTLLLDEISEVPASLQPKLLRAIQEQEFERLGSIETKKVSVRFISTSNRNMPEHIENKAFREDLYFRLNVIPIYLPPLRERSGDILPLAKHLLKKACKEHQTFEKIFSEEAENALIKHHWPGNIRELWNVTQRAAVMASSSIIGEDDLLLEPKKEKIETKTCFPKLKKLSEIEEKYILETLEACGGNKTKAAKVLDISIRTLRNKLNNLPK